VKKTEKNIPEMPNDPLLKVSRVDAFHGTFQALWDVSLSVDPGEIVAIIGANGSGKSTLMETISGLLHPAKGTIEFEGMSISLLEPYNIVSIGISLVPEGGRVFSELSVIDNLIVGSFNRQSRLVREQNLRRVYQLFPVLGARKNQQAKTLSGGEQQMLAIGRSLMSGPKLMLLDEMSLGLAPILVNELYRALKGIINRGITVLFVEQNVRRSLTEARRAYVLEAGRIVLSGYADELLEEETVKKAYFGHEEN
jgi:branched-chain amino acid transport system ATP-binding protein